MSKKLAYIFWSFHFTSIAVVVAAIGANIEGHDFFSPGIRQKWRIVAIDHSKRSNISNLSRIKRNIPYAREATLLYEDRYFFWHLGINPYSLVRAMWTTYVKTKGDRGFNYNYAVSTLFI